MHGVALRLMMNSEQKAISGWLGYKRDLEYVNDEQAREDQEAQDLWNQAEDVSNKEKVLLGELKQLLGWEEKGLEDENEDYQNVNLMEPFILKYKEIRLRKNSVKVQANHLQNSMLMMPQTNELQRWGTVQNLDIAD